MLREICLTAPTVVVFAASVALVANVLENWLELWLWRREIEAAKNKVSKHKAAKQREPNLLQLEARIALHASQDNALGNTPDNTPELSLWALTDFGPIPEQELDCADTEPMIGL